MSERILESIDDTIFMTAEGIVHLGVTIAGAVYQQSPGPDVLDVAIANPDIAKDTGRTLFMQ